nr:MAG TPA: hypothetical protein [Caudoviricetes sp.]
MQMNMKDLSSNDRVLIILYQFLLQHYYEY